MHFIQLTLNSRPPGMGLEFVKNVNSHIKNGYQLYGKLVTVRDSVSSCTSLYQVVVKYRSH